MRSFTLLSSVAFVTAAVGCTLLVKFEEVPADDGDSSTSPPDRDVDVPDPVPDASEGGIIIGPDGGPIPFPPPCDPEFPRDQVTCNPSFPRPNCAKNTAIFASYPASYPRENDLVVCNGGTTPTCVMHCPFGCAQMLTGFPDACDDCNGRKDGTYCMKDLRGTDGRTHGLAVDCKDGGTVEVYNCGIGKCATDCPRTEREPSCCVP
jgi:hypothetical protein